MDSTETPDIFMMPSKYSSGLVVKLPAGLRFVKLDWMLSQTLKTDDSDRFILFFKGTLASHPVAKQLKAGTEATRTGDELVFLSDGDGAAFSSDRFLF